jgi:hypothetical protein
MGPEADLPSAQFVPAAANSFLAAGDVKNWTNSLAASAMLPGRPLCDLTDLRRSKFNGHQRIALDVRKRRRHSRSPPVAPRWTAQVTNSTQALIDQFEQNRSSHVGRWWWNVLQMQLGMKQNRPWPSRLGLRLPAWEGPFFYLASFDARASDYWNTVMKFDDNPKAADISALKEIYRRNVRWFCDA